MFQKILLTVDLADTDIAQSAIGRAVEMTSKGGGALRLIYVRPLMPLMMLEYVPDGFDAERQAEAEARVKELAGKLPIPADRVTMVVRQGGVYPEVIAEAESWGADVIVAGSHRPAMSTYLLGSNASAIVRHAPCSVLVVRS
ncbi:MAG: universal stress protein UspA [Rhizobiales bacterium 65-9]|nr:universal stress protein [Hyphomicrobiales bacterium]OJY34286.1 MAG: universal stress protein UspA [Rhizobiales bacterium 65-9]